MHTVTVKPPLQGRSRESASLHPACGLVVRELARSASKYKPERVGTVRGYVLLTLCISVVSLRAASVRSSIFKSVSRYVLPLFHASGRDVEYNRPIRSAGGVMRAGAQHDEIVIRGLNAPSKSTRPVVVADVAFRTRTHEDVVLYRCEAVVIIIANVASASFAVAATLLAAS